MAEDIDVRVQHGRIAEVGRGLRPTASDATVIDLPGRTMLPGLIDCHVHIIDDSLDIEPIAYQVARAVPVLTTLLMNGFTTVRDLGSADQPLNVSLKRAVAEGTLPGPRLFVAPNMISASGGHGDKQPALSERYNLLVGTHPRRRRGGHSSYRPRSGSSRRRLDQVRRRWRLFIPQRRPHRHRLHPG